MRKIQGATEKTVEIPLASVILEGDLCLPDNFKGIILFAHGSGSSRNSPRNRYLARVLQNAGFGTLLFDLLTEEDEIDKSTGKVRFDVALLTNRLVGTTDWLLGQFDVSDGDTMPFLGYFGASTGAAAALAAAAQRADVIGAVVCRGGRADLATRYLDQVRAPTLLIVGAKDEYVLKLNKDSLDKLVSLQDDERKLEVIPGSSHLFEEEGKLEQVAEAAKKWFTRIANHSEPPHGPPSQESNSPNYAQA